MATVDLKALARVGAAMRADELKAELLEIYRAFPARGRRGADATERVNGGDGAAPARRRRRKPMSAAQKKAVSARMKKYWAARRKVQK